MFAAAFEPLAKDAIRYTGMGYGCNNDTLTMSVLPGRDGRACPSLMLLMAAGVMISPHRRARSVRNPVVEARGKEHVLALHGKAGHEMGSKHWESDALQALNVQAPDVAGNFATNLHKTTHHKSADE
jgi:hypothetical protein